MGWKQAIQPVFNDYFEVIVDEDTKEIIMVVDIFDNEFVKNIINKHNDAVSKAYAKGLEDGCEIVKTVKNFK